MGRTKIASLESYRILRNVGSIYRLCLTMHWDEKRHRTRWGDRVSTIRKKEIQVLFQRVLHETGYQTFKHLGTTHCGAEHLEAMMWVSMIRRKGKRVAQSIKGVSRLTAKTEIEELKNRSSSLKREKLALIKKRRWDVEKRLLNRETNEKALYSKEADEPRTHDNK